MRGCVIALITVTWFNNAHAQPAPPLVCRVEKKIDSERTYSQTDLNRSRFSVEILPDSTTTRLRRCSFTPSVGRVTCDEYNADRVAIDTIAGIRKFYYFSGQFDVQVFSDGSFIENNGRGSIAFGTCSAR